MDFTDLNKACLKDLFPMPRIDQLVDAIVDHPWMSFLDTFQGYHQIPLALDDQERTAFCYSYRELPLQDDALWFKECKGYLPEDDDQDVLASVREKH